MTGLIYKHTNVITKKVYVGQTITTMEKRFKQHCRDSRNKTSVNSKFHRAIRKYGKDCWESEVIVDNVPIELLDGLEINCIAMEDGYINGYNTTEGGGTTLGYRHTEEAKEKISRDRKGKYVGDNNPMYGKTFSKEHREKISKSLKNSDKTRKPKSAEHKRKIGEAHKNMWLGTNSMTFTPWYYITPDGNRVDVYDTTKRDWAKNNGIIPESKVLCRFEKRKLDKKIPRGYFKGWVFGNINEEIA
jgi:group I intron endonuclease